MFKIEDFKGVPVQELQEKLTNDIVAYQAEIATLSQEELEKQEEELMAEMKVSDDYIAGVAYELPERVQDPDGTEVTAKTVCDYIRDFLDDIESTWQTSLGIYQSISYWKNFKKGDKVSYAAYDSTTRMLGTMKFKGEIKLRKLLTINNYFSAAHVAYVEDMLYLNYLAARHDAILKAMQALAQAGTPDDPSQIAAGM